MKSEMELAKIIGKKIVTIKGWKDRKNAKDIDAEFILFDDGETILKLDHQDYDTYHDCSSSARTLEVIKNKEYYNTIMGDTDRYGDATKCCIW